MPVNSEHSHSFVVVSNRLPVDRVTDPNGEVSWKTSPGGLVTAMEPVVKQLGCVWVGWPGFVGEKLEPFEAVGMSLAPVALDEDDFAQYYEGFSNDTIWPLYHDVISQPGYHREWWDRYVAVNRRFAQHAADVAEQSATVWVHDYQLQLVPQMLRDLRPDLTIAFFLHIPFPAHGLFGQLPWRREVLEGLLGADVIGFQRVADAANFRAAVRRFVGAPSNGNMIQISATDTLPARQVLAQEFPISIDVSQFEELANDPAVIARAKEIREELGNPDTIMLGVDRLDYTKGIRHRLKAFWELLDEGKIQAGNVTMVQVASPSRERVEAYRRLRDEIEVTVSRINGDHGAIGAQPVVYLHRGFPRSEMAALYLAADVLVVTALRDGMNLVAKEYVACRGDERGALVLSEFAGAADELRRAVLVNPHDINGLKSAFLTAIDMSDDEQRTRMRAMRRVVHRADVTRWSGNFLRAVQAQAAERASGSTLSTMPAGARPLFLPVGVDAALRRFVTEQEILIACDFDGTLAPIVRTPDAARILPRAESALDALQDARGVTVALVSGRSFESLTATGVRTEGRSISGSHGAELILPGQTEFSPIPLTESEKVLRETLKAELEQLTSSVPGSRLETKPYGFAVHAREVADENLGAHMLAAAAQVGERHGVHGRTGKQVYELAVRRADKGTALNAIRAALPEDTAVMYIGDDVTDEDALAVLGPGDLGIHVGKGKTAAAFSVSNVSEVAEVLARLAKWRTGKTIGWQGDTQNGEE